VDLLNPDLIKRARDEYEKSLPSDRAYAQKITSTNYGGTFGDSRGRGFDAWFEKNYINNPNSPLSDQERMSLQQLQAGVVPAPGSRFVQTGSSLMPVTNYDAAMAQQVYQNLLAQSLQQANLFNDYMNQGMGINNALTAATSGQTMGTMPQQTAGTIPQQQIPIQMPAVQQSQQPTQFGQVNQQAMQNFNNLVQNGISQENANQNNLGDMYRSLQPPFAQIGPARQKPNPMISQNFGSIAGGIGNIMPKTPKPF
jgi:hypothetical protein